MAYALNDDFVQEVTVEATYFGQQIIQRHYYRYSDPLAPLPGTSTAFLLDFRTAFRANIIPVMFTDYIVSRYVLRQVRDASMILPGPPSTWRTLYSTAYDILVGAAGDIGLLPVGVGLDYLPNANAMRIKKNPATPWRGFFKASYVRTAPHNNGQLDPDEADHDRWSPATITTYTDAWTLMVTAGIQGEVGGNGWLMGIWSAPFFGRISKPAGLAPFSAVEPISSATCRPYVGTQITRRYKPLGGFRGV